MEPVRFHINCNLFISSTHNFGHLKMHGNVILSSGDTNKNMKDKLSSKGLSES